MDKKASSSQDPEIRMGPWTMEEDLILINYIANHGEGVWNTLARSAGMKRTGKSCRLRWLNYLRPDARRGNITPEEQLLIMELHSRHRRKLKPVLGESWKSIPHMRLLLSRDCGTNVCTISVLKHRSMELKEHVKKTNVNLICRNSRRSGSHYQGSKQDTI